jgi:hypothetical protein
MQTSEKESIDLMVRLRQVFDEVSAEEEKESIEAPNVNDK